MTEQWYEAKMHGLYIYPIEIVRHSKTSVWMERADWKNGGVMHERRSRMRIFPTREEAIAHVRLLMDRRITSARRTYDEAKREMVKLDVAISGKAFVMPEREKR